MPRAQTPPPSAGRLRSGMFSADAATGRRLERLVGEILPFLSDRQINAAIRLAFLR